MIKWTEQYNCFKATVAKDAVTLCANWRYVRSGGENETGYFVNVNGRSLREPFRDIQAAKDAAVRLARKIVAEAAAELEESVG